MINIKSADKKKAVALKIRTLAFRITAFINIK